MIDPSPFAGAARWGEAGPGRTAGSVPPSWAQGRAIFGGLVGAVALGPMLRLVPPERRLRSLSMTFAGPVEPAPAAAECSTGVVREGRSVTIVESRIVQAGSVRCIAVGAFGGERPSALAIPGRPAPEAPPAAEATELPYAEGLLPVFLQHYERRWISGGFPFTSAADSHLLAYGRLRDAGRQADLCDLLGLVDAWPPAGLQMLGGPAPSSTLSWTIDFPSAGAEGRTDEWWLYEARAVAAGGGYAQTEAWLWDPRGRAAARSVQVVAIFG